MMCYVVFFPLVTAEIHLGRGAPTQLSAKAARDEGRVGAENGENGQN